jgi:hypothetical protein
LHTANSYTIADCFFDFGELGDMGDVEDTELMFPKQELIEDNSSSSMIDTQSNAYMQAPAGFANLQPLPSQPPQQQPQQQQQWQQPYAPVAAAAAAAPQRSQRSQYEPMELHEERKRKASSAAPTLSTDKMAMKDLTEQQKLERRVRIQYCLSF